MTLKPASIPKKAPRAWHSSTTSTWVARRRATRQGAARASFHAREASAQPTAPITPQGTSSHQAGFHRGARATSPTAPAVQAAVSRDAPRWLARAASRSRRPQKSRARASGISATR